VSYGRKTRILAFPKSPRRYLQDVYTSVRGLSLALYPVYWSFCCGYLLHLDSVEQVIAFMFFMLPLHYLYGAWMLISHARVIHHMNTTLRRIVRPLSKQTRRKMQQRMRKRAKTGGI
jgi:hypothetical protein